MPVRIEQALNAAASLYPTEAESPPTNSTGRVTGAWHPVTEAHSEPTVAGNGNRHVTAINRHITAANTHGAAARSILKGMPTATKQVARGGVEASDDFHARANAIAARHLGNPISAGRKRPPAHQALHIGSAGRSFDQSALQFVASMPVSTAGNGTRHWHPNPQARVQPSDSLRSVARVVDVAESGQEVSSWAHSGA